MVVHKNVAYVQCNNSRQGVSVEFSLRSLWDETCTKTFLLSEICATIMLTRANRSISRVNVRYFGLTHVDAQTGTPVMVDVSHKATSVRVAHAQVQQLC